MAFMGRRDRDADRPEHGRHGTGPGPEREHPAHGPAQLPRPPLPAPDAARPYPDRRYAHDPGAAARTAPSSLRIPGGYDRSRPYRLVLGFHWWGGTSTDIATGRTVETGTWAYYGLQRLANDSAVFVAPQGLDNGWANAGGEDVTFVDDMLRRIESDLCVDTTQRFALGFSYGAAMSYALACSRATVFRAVAIQSGGQLSGCSGGTQPIAYFGVHGLRDSVLGISGGRAMRDRFVGNNGCTPQNPPEPAQGSLTHPDHRLLRLLGRASGGLGRVRRRTHRRPAGRRPR
ncbi:hypothetical protein LT493_23435 [Streptomyces tricolor]|nr:hypothetical protein [Streptomyces tricolor]